MSLPASCLFAQQAALQGWLMHGDASASGFIAGDRHDERLRIYRDAYQLRLIDVLANDYPVLRVVVGEAMFETLATGYLHAHPSRHPSVRHFGRNFADWLRRQEHPSTWSMLADFEWMQGEVFDAADSPVITMEEIAAVPADAWPELRLQLQPAMRMLRTPTIIPAMVAAHGGDRPLPTPDGGTTVNWLLWRRDFIVHWRQLDDDEAGLLESVRAGASFSDLCTQLAAHVPETDTALRAVGLLKLWISEGLVAAAIPSPNATSRGPCHATLRHFHEETTG